MISVQRNMRIELENMFYIIANLSDKFDYSYRYKHSCMRNKFSVITELINVQFIVVIDTLKHIRTQYLTLRTMTEDSKQTLEKYYLSETSEIISRAAFASSTLVHYGRLGVCTLD